jgi:hypothetical protein
MDIHIGTASFTEILVLVTAFLGWLSHVRYSYKLQLRRLYMWSQGRNGVVSWIYAEKTVVSCFLQALGGLFIQLAVMNMAIPEPVRSANRSGNHVLLWSLILFNIAIAMMGPALHWITKKIDQAVEKEDKKHQTDNIEAHKQGMDDAEHHNI